MKDQLSNINKMLDNSSCINFEICDVEYTLRIPFEKVYDKLPNFSIKNTTKSNEISVNHHYSILEYSIDFSLEEGEVTL